MDPALPGNPPPPPPDPGYAPAVEMPIVGFEGLDGPPPAPDSNRLYPTLEPQPSPNGDATGNNPVNITVNPIGFDAAGHIDSDLPDLTGDSGNPDGVALLGSQTLIENSVDMPPDVENPSTEPKRSSREELEEKRNSLKFRDGVRRIDFILAYTDTADPKKSQRRETFEQNLLEEGLELEYEDKKTSQDGNTYYVKVHTPWEVLTRMAELLNTKMPIKEYDTSFSEKSCWDCIPNPFALSEDIVKPEDDYFTADFSRDREQMFIIKDKDSFFTHAQRSSFTYELLLRTQYEAAKDKIGIDRLISQGVFEAAYPLHEGPYKSDHSILSHGPLNDRHLLYEAWAKPGRWYFEQPLDLVRRYFGEKVAIYFTWLGFYTTMLIPASIVGVIVFIYGFITLFSNHPSNEICDPEGPGNFTMCPLCDRRCSYWKLETSCRYSQLTYLFDNYGTVFLAGFMAIWSTMFLELWKRRQAELQYDWDVADYELEERMRPDFEAQCQDHQKLNPVTQLMEPFLPVYYKIPRFFTSLSVVLFMISCVLMAVFGVIMYRIIVVTILYASDNDFIRQNAKMTTSITAACINLVAILILNKLYNKVAEWLTNLERPRTDSDYEDSYTLKMYLFQFINFYSSIFYIAFIKGRVADRPGQRSTILGKQQEQCDPAGCLNELCIQLVLIMVGKQALNNFQELLLPMLKNWFSRRKVQKETEDNLYTRWEQDKNLVPSSPLGLFAEYLEMVLQYGFVTIFVAAFPLAPLFALINNIIEIRLDAYKFITQQQRPVSVRAQDIGIWYGILTGVSFISVLSNAFIIGVTSDFVPKLMYQYTVSPDQSMAGYINHSLSYFDVHDFQNQSVPDNPMTDEYGVVDYCRYSDYRSPPWDENKYVYTSFYWHVFTARLAFIIAFEHVVFFFTWLVTYLVPDVPRHVKQLMLRELYIAKEARYTAAFANVHEDKEERKREEEETGPEKPEDGIGPEAV